MGPMDTDPTELGKSLHARLLAGDVTASAEIAEQFFPRVLDLLRKRYPRLDDPHLVDTAVADTFLSYLTRPAQYDPAQLPLLSYLRMSADRDVRNLLKKPLNQVHLVSLDQVVELEDSSAEYQLADDFDLEHTVIVYTAPIWQRLAELLPNPMDQELLLLMLEKVRSTEVYATLLEISDRPAAEQAAIVKRHKDRVIKVVQRGIKLSELKDDE
jgi:DNA-directed RNA polymerase specialized sigma24 family protein